MWRGQIILHVEQNREMHLDDYGFGRNSYMWQWHSNKKID